MLSREQILQALLATTVQNENMIWMLAGIKMTEHPVQKEHLRDVANTIYKRIHPDADQLPIRSRHLLDEAAAMLEGAALVEVAEIAKTKQYTLSALGEELLQYRHQQRQLQKSKGKDV